MPENLSPRLHPLLSIVLTLLIVLLGFQIIGPMLGLLISLPFYPGDIATLFKAIEDPVKHPELKPVLFIMQGSGTIVGLILIPAIIFRRQQRSLAVLFQKPVYLLPSLIVVVTVIVFMVVNSVFVEWNQHIEFPKVLSGFEDWAKRTEMQLAELTAMLTQFNSIGELIIAFVVIAVLPAIGEEIVFRGMIQKDLHTTTRNIHLAIWISAILFSAIHLQFYGFVPRVLLGALFGYLYYWSGNLIMPVLAHFVNNGFTVMAMYFYQRGSIDVDLENTESAPWSAVAFSTILTVTLLYSFRKFYQDRPESHA